MEKWTPEPSPCFSSWPIQQKQFRAAWEEELGEAGGNTRTPVPKGTTEWVGLPAETLAPEMLGR